VVGCCLRRIWKWTICKSGARRGSEELVLTRSTLFLARLLTKRAITCPDSDARTHVPLSTPHLHTPRNLPSHHMQPLHFTKIRPTVVQHHFPYDDLAFRACRTSTSHGIDCSQRLGKCIAAIPPHQGPASNGISMRSDEIFQQLLNHQRLIAPFPAEYAYPPAWIYALGLSLATTFLWQVGRYPSLVLSHQLTASPAPKRPYCAHARPLQAC
jgi:hypothetical protein